MLFSLLIVAAVPPIRPVRAVPAPVYFLSPPTPPCGSTLEAAVGQRLNFTVAAITNLSLDFINITLSAISLPTNASVIPTESISLNFAKMNFSYAPTPKAVGTQTTIFQATATNVTSNAFLGSASCTINILVSPLVIPEYPWVGTLLSVLISITTLLTYAKIRDRETLRDRVSNRYTFIDRSLRD